MQKIEFGGRLSCTGNILLNWILEMLKNKGINNFEILNFEGLYDIVIYEKIQ
jgi:hypothetical protein